MKDYLVGCDDIASKDHQQNHNHAIIIILFIFMNMILKFYHVYHGYNCDHEFRHHLMMTKFLITIISIINMIKLQNHIHENEQNNIFVKDWL